MNGIKKQSIISHLLWIIFTGLLVYFLWWKWQLAFSRYFDVDEFAYLHWAYNITQGQIPFLDFFYFFPPLFIWLLSLLFTVGQGVVPVIGGGGGGFFFFL